MVSEEFQIISEHGLNLSAKSWLPPSAPEAILCVVHGFAEHSGRYAHLADPFTRENIGIFTADLRSHGHSEGKRSNGSFNAYLLDIQELVITARREFNDVPIFLLGHGFGGLLVAYYLIKLTSKEIKGAIISAPWINMHQNISARELRMASVLKNVYPSMTLSPRINANELTNDPGVADKYTRDPLVNPRMSARLFFDIEKAFKYVMSNAHRIGTPVLICHGDEDTLTASAQSSLLASLIPSSTLKIWENTKHEPHNDRNRQEVIAFYIQWIKQRQ